MGGPGTLDDLNNNSGYEQKGWFEQASGRGSALLSSQQGLGDATSPPEVAVATAMARWEILQAVASPGKALMSNGLGWLISIALSPLIEYIIEPAVGDPQQMRATAQGWEQVALWLDHVAEAEPRRATATADVWQGEAGDAFRAQVEEFGGGVAALAGEVRELKETLESIADLFDMFIEFAIELLTEFVIGLIVQWLAALVASWVTAGASVAAASATTTAHTAITGSRLAQAVAKLQRLLGKAFTKIEGFLQKIRGRISKVIEKMGDLRGGNFAQKWLGRRIDGINPAIGWVTRADNFGVSTTANRFAKDVFGEQALATNIAGSVLKSVLGGASSWSQAAWNAGTAAAADAAVSYGADTAYGIATETSSNSERGDAMDDGFSM